jgi:DNA-binding transcriptional LysR family regulator
MDYNRVALFVRVVKAGSFTAAAAQVGLPKSSLSRGVSHLEEQLGVRLLQRTTRKLALTDVGQTYFDAVAESIGAMDVADAAAREGGAVPRGPVRLTAAPDSLALAAAVAQFTRRHPEIRVELTITPRYVDLVAEGFDLAVRAGRLEDSSLVARRIGSAELALMAAPAYLRRRGRPKKVAELDGHDWVLYRGTDGRASLELTGPDGGKQTVAVTGAIVADDLSLVRHIVEAGAGLALLPIASAVEGVAARRLEVVLPGWHLAGASVWVVLPSGRYVPARVALLRDFLVEHLGAQLAATHARCKATRRRGRR